MFIIVTIICSLYSVLANESANCDCDVLYVKSINALIPYQNFTKQNGVLNGKPYYFSNEGTMIVWHNDYWSYDKYDASLKEWDSTQINVTKPFSFDNMCKRIIQQINYKGTLTHVSSQCLEDNSNCLATQKQEVYGFK